VDNRIVVRVPANHAVDVGAALGAWLRRQARADIAKRLPVRAKEMRQRPGRVYVMGQRTKWGGCSRRRNLSFNWRLVMAPPEVLDYIVVHELGHLAEPYHSTKFWLIVRSYCGDYDRHRRWLRDHEETLMSRNVVRQNRGHRDRCQPSLDAS
jgi:predicted metal-dependent hydrolase